MTILFDITVTGFLLGALYLLLLRRYTHLQMVVAAGLVVVLAIVVVDALGQWPFFEWLAHQTIDLLRDKIRN